MGKVRIVATGEERLLRTWNAVGSGDNQHIELSADGVSRQHAEIKWYRQRWLVSSKGQAGLFVQGTRLAPGEWSPLEAGAELGLSPSAPLLVFVDDAPPRAFAEHRDDLRQVAADEQDVIHLPEGLVWFDPEIGWMVSDADGPRPTRPRVGPWAIVDPTKQADATVVRPRFFSKATAVFSEDGPGKAKLVLEWPDHEPIDFGSYADLHVLMCVAKRRGEGDGWVSLDQLVEDCLHAPETIVANLCRARWRIVPEPIVGADQIYEARSGARRFGLPPDQVRFEA